MPLTLTGGHRRRRAFAFIVAAGLFGFGVGYFITLLSGPWPLAVALVGCGVMLRFVVRELIWLRKMRRQLETLEQDIRRFDESPGGR